MRYARNVPGPYSFRNVCAGSSRKEIDELTEFAKSFGAKGLVTIAVGEEGVKSSISKFLTDDQVAAIVQRAQAKTGDLLAIVADKADVVANALGRMRAEMGKKLGLADPNEVAFAWVIDFPLVEWDENEKRWDAMHHPFTSPKQDHIKMLESSPGDVKANAYDMVINGVELGGGSIRIHNKNVQQMMFRALGFSEEEAKAKFGFLMDAFEYGAPPHGGIAFGFDRLCAMFGGADSIRDFIAFPKNNSGRDTMINTPGPISQEQLDELYLIVKPR